MLGERRSLEANIEIDLKEAAGCKVDVTGSEPQLSGEPWYQRR
jgi:hypothetical protein